MEEVILDYKEHEDILKLALTSNNLSSAVPTWRNPKTNQEFQARTGRRSSSNNIPGLAPGLTWGLTQGLTPGWALTTGRIGKINGQKPP